MNGLVATLALLVALATPRAARAQPATGVIRPGVAWFDTAGARVYAGGADVVWEPSASLFYMVGEGNKTFQDCSDGFNLYSSPDLDSSSWTLVGQVLKNEDVRAAAPPPFNDPAKYPFYRMERPKVFKCPTTANASAPWRLVFHCDTSDFAMTSVGVLTAPAVTGPYTFASKCFQPDGRASYDMGTFVDDARMPGGDGRAYLVRSVENSFAGISGFDDECLTTTGIVSGGTPKMEGQAIMRDVQGVLHMIGSHETGWSPNAAIFLTSPNSSLVGATWIDAYNPTGDGSTYQSQSTFFLPFHRADGSVVHIYMGDRWNAYGPGGLQNMTVVWLPLLPPSGPAPTVVQPGWQLQTTLCNASDPTQQLAWHAGGTVTHEPSGLCITAAADSPDRDTTLSAEVCGAPRQTWYKTGVAFSNTTFGLGNGCSNWNAGNGYALGAPIILYRCGNSTAWNSRWDAPLAPDTPSVFQGVSDISLTGYCLALRPQHDPSLFYIPWLDEWRVADINVTAAREGAGARSPPRRAVPLAAPPPRPARARAPAPAPARAPARQQAPPAADIAVVVNDTVPLRRFNGPSYLCVNIDTASLFHGLDLTDPVLVNLMYALTMNTNGVIRVGGTAADYTIYVPDSTDPTGGDPAGRETVISDATLDAIFSFAGQTHATVLLDLNALQFRTPEGAWDPAGNATALLQRLNARYGGAINWDFSLGNEPNFWPIKVNYTQLGEDVTTLARLLKGLDIGQHIYGPSIGSTLEPEIAAFLAASKGSLQGLTVHDYPLGRNCTLAAMLNRAPVDALARRLAALANLTRSVAEWYVELVLEEVAPMYDGGCEGLTDRFADGFFFQASLAAVAAAGFDRYSRQDLAGWSGTQEASHYQLVGTPGWARGSAAMTPHPSWFTAMLFKQLVGEKMLAAALTGDAGVLAQVTIAAWCPGAPWWFGDGLILSFANPTGADVTFSVATASGNLSAAPRTEYVLTSSAAAYHDAHARARARAHARGAAAAPSVLPPDSLTGDETFLNGVLWTVNDNGLPPAASPVPGNDVNDAAQPVLMPAYSHGFVRFPSGAEGLRAC